MNIAVFILVCAIVLGIPLSFLLFPSSRFPRVLAALVLIGLALFGIFGFMASYEYSEPAERLPWQVGYGALCFACLGGAVLLLRRTSSFNFYVNPAAIIHYITGTFPGVDVVVGSKEAGSPEMSWGDTFFFYDPKRDLDPDRRFPFATIVTRDYGDFDCASNLNRPDVFRLNIGVSKETFRSLFGDEADGKHDFTALDRIMPHPVYGKMFWICVLNPSGETFEKVKPLLAEAYRRAAEKDVRGEK